MIYWFTGQPGSGKTVLADLLKEKFLPHAYRIDGDEMRDLFQNKDYSMNGRVKNIDAAQKIAHYLHNQGKDVIVSLVSPYRDQREEFKSILDTNDGDINVLFETLEKSLQGHNSSLMLSLFRYSTSITGMRLRFNSMLARYLWCPSSIVLVVLSIKIGL